MSMRLVPPTVPTAGPNFSLLFLDIDHDITRENSNQSMNNINVCEWTIAILMMWHVAIDIDVDVIFELQR